MYRMVHMVIRFFVKADAPSAMIQVINCWKLTEPVGFLDSAHLVTTKRAFIAKFVQLDVLSVNQQLRTSSESSHHIVTPVSQPDSRTMDSTIIPMVTKSYASPDARNAITQLKNCMSYQHLEQGRAGIVDRVRLVPLRKEYTASHVQVGAQNVREILSIFSV